MWNRWCLCETSSFIFVQLVFFFSCRICYAFFKSLSNTLAMQLLSHFTSLLLSFTFSSTIVSAEYDYYFEIGSNNEYSNHQQFGCTEWECSVNKTWLINGTCINPTLTVSIVETLETVTIFIHNDQIGQCMPEVVSENTDALQLVRCSDIDNYNISEYLIMKSNRNINFLNVTLTLGNRHCKGCWFEDYRLYGQVSITCDSNYLIQQCTNNSKLGFNILVGYSTTDYSLNWNVLSSDNGVLLSSYHDRMYNENEFVSQTVCIASAYQCFLLNITDANGNGIADYGGYFELFMYDVTGTYSYNYYGNSSYKSNVSLTLGAQSFDDYDTYLQYCVDQSATNSLTILFAKYEYDKTLLITIKSYYTNDAIYQNKYLSHSTTSSATSSVSLFVSNGCYEIEFVDLTQNLFDYDHGIHTIYINNNIAGFGGRYFQSDTLAICTEANYISYCIIPEFCKNNTQISKLIDYGTIYAQYPYVNNYTSGNVFEEPKVNHTNITAFSYKSINHYTYGLDMIGFNCYGAVSCIQISASTCYYGCSSGFVFTWFSCYGSMSCYHISFISLGYRHHTRLFCESFMSCKTILGKQDYDWGYKTVVINMYVCVFIHVIFDEKQKYTICVSILT